MLTASFRYTGAVYLEGNYTRLDWLVDSPAVSFGSTSLPVRVGLKRNSDNLCTFSATVWDPTQGAFTRVLSAF